MYEASYLATKRMVFGAITCIRKNRDMPPPSNSWFTKFLNKYSNLFNIIKTKPIARVRVELHDKKELKEWFRELRSLVDQYNIQPQNIHNFDKTGIRVGCAKRVEVVVPAGISNVYTASPEDRRTITVIETICAAGSVIPPILIIPAKLHMESWIHDNLQKDVRLFVSETGYTNNDLGIRYLHHFITHSKAF